MGKEQLREKTKEEEYTPQEDKVHKELAKRLGMTLKRLREILKGKT